jgi:asparagine synthase (glutamine-hydrolysing)
MCGLNGIFSYNRSAGLPKQAELLATRDAMTARGPDGAGEWWSEDRRLGLGHRRLTILDLSERAGQPMISACGRHVVVFNGEIYNYPALRRELEAQSAVFRTTSDTEVLLHLFARDGAAMTAKLRGMFAFAIWDKAERRLFVARDPYGIKPLYTSNDGWTFRIASQVKALLAGGVVSRDPEPAGIVGFHIWGSVPEPFTLYRDIRALPAGHSQWIDEAGPHEPTPYASITQVFAEGAANPAPADEIATRVRAGALESISAHLLADVEVGVFLSAGIDSGALLGLMRDAGQQKIRAITLAFEEFRGTADDEAPLAAEIAKLYGAEHIVRRVSEAEFKADLPLILAAMDQPSIDGVNTWFIAKAAREAGLKVALSGLGGDEILAGYPSFEDIPRWLGMLRWPSAVPGLGVAIRMAWPQVAAMLNLKQLSPKAGAMVEHGGSIGGAYLLRRGVFLPHELSAILAPDLVCNGLHRLALAAEMKRATVGIQRSGRSCVAALESTFYMRNQLLRDTDWASMAHSVEVRTPLVDVELLRRLAPLMPRLANRAGKSALARAPLQHLPDAVISRAKTGFSVPIGHWSIASRRSEVPSKALASRAQVRRVIANPGFLGDHFNTLGNG